MRDILKSFEFLSKKREEKPRTCGLTMVLDKGLGLETASSLMDISGEYVDYLKFGWGTSIVHEQDIRDEGIAIGLEQGRNDKIAIVQRLLQKDYSISR